MSRLAKSRFSVLAASMVGKVEGWLITTVVAPAIPRLATRVMVSFLNLFMTNFLPY